jgi:hypothetical protein
VTRTPRRWWLVPIVLVSIALVALGAAWPVVRAKTRAAVEARCRSALAGECSVASLELSREGVSLTDVRARGVGNTVRARIASVHARFSWWDVLTSSRATPLELRIRGVELGEDAPLADFVREARRWREARVQQPSGERRSRVSLVRLDVDQLSMSAQIAPFAQASLQGGAVNWAEGTPARVSWADVSIALGPLTAFQTGRCLFELPVEGGPSDVQCERFRARLDAADAVEQARSVTGWLQLLRSLADRPSAAAPAPLPSAPGAVRRFAAPTSWRLRAREGVVELRRGESSIATFSSASFEVDIEQGSLRSARARLGSAQQGPALDLAVTRPTEGGWELETSGEALPLGEVARWIPGVPWHEVERGRVRVRGTLRPVGDGVFEARGQCELRDFGLSHAKLSREPLVGLSVGLQGSGRVDLSRRRVETSDLDITVNDVRARLSGWAERDREHTALDVTGTLQRTSCDGIRRALPPSLTGPVSEITFGGDIAGTVALALDTRHIDDTRFVVNLEDRCFVARDTYSRGVQRFSGPFVQRVQEPERVRAFVTGPGTAAWVPIADIAPHMVNAVLSREDGRFYRHAGVDPAEIRNAIVRNVSAGRFVYGASTVSMQLAKNVFLAREKTLVRKLQEFVLTWYLERTLGKDAILELYLNVVEFGPGVYGIGPASRFYFGVEPAMLTPLQAIYIATLLPNPVQRSGSFFRGAASAGTMAMLRAHARIMQGRGLLTPEELATANTEPLTFRPRRGPVNGVLTLEVDPLLEDGVAVARALAIPVPAGVAPREPNADDPTALHASTREPEREPDQDDPPDETEQEPAVVRVGLHRPTVRIH